MSKYHFKEGHSHEYVWWRLTDATYQTLVIKEISQQIGCRIYQAMQDFQYASELVNFISGSAYIIEESPVFETRTEVLRFLSDHAHECNYLIPYQVHKLPTKFFKVVTLKEGIELWVDRYNLATIEIEDDSYPCVTEKEAQDFLIEYQDLMECEYALLHTTEPLFEKKEDVRIIGAGDHYPMTVLGRIWLDHPFSKNNLKHWIDCAKRDGIIVRKDDCSDKSWVYLLKVNNQNLERGFAIVSEKNLKSLTPDDIDEMIEDLEAAFSSSQNRYMLNRTPESLFKLYDDVTWVIADQDGEDISLSYFLFDIYGNRITNSRSGIEKISYSELNVRIDDYFWLESPASRGYLDAIENQFRSNGYFSFMNFDRSRSKVWIYMIRFSCEGSPHVFFVPEEQLRKSQISYTNFLKCAEDPGSYILIEKVKQLSLKSPRFWDLAFLYEINPDFIALPVLIKSKRENENEL